ncbi:N-succinyl-L-ornithine transcarbamylase [Dyadobacter sp. BE34]|uniref:N-succinylornithine carbamoyltransferase n=1 Tax=Dyadobacter fermentans TaxID=94254 RepID=A0ABU1QQM0_9BACT|nr:MULTISPECIES: N-acetylornithine carbamoyltransferase [Dyadobacter]MDR6803378.1 N-succinyl-L-ornithine transcarbamylase [Dyadobacter fermentans]MDR7041119.1 N-succinyl-L-ornithine transcarbamylase [Dyadobacter sp. BE242]MDR7195522.1 N-succinyl-L-ornithine transcarbamylase [Dyadobacter sp. BE34]MDR7213933.1 N-succinyl-L-ornithine transcarbamylase [Dyadobacter sp. BE31]MDR7260929.1 N-succinyl-L-ornithine transcarbamylase [Dyadobacter sp. BE32]
MKHFLSIKDVTDLPQLISSGIAAKKDPFADQTLGKNKTIGLLFFNSSLRTRISTQKAAQNLGLNVITMNVGQDGWGLEMEEGVIMNGDKAEHVKEAAAVIGSYCDIIGIRSFAGLQDRDKDYSEIVFQQFKKYANAPIVNLESATRHPLQSLADCITIEEFKLKKRPKVVLTWLPHFKALPQAVANSFCEWMNPMDVDFVITHPEGYDLSPDFVGRGQVIYDQDTALEGADFVYGKNWSSYNSYGHVLNTDPSWMITEAKMALTDNGKFMHCLPVRRNMKVADEVLDGPRSLVIEQAANREWSAQAALKEVLLGL